MNLKLLILICSILIILSSCHKVEKQIPNIPENLSIDVDNDGVDDFLIKYYWASIYSPTSNEGIICEFEILGENEKLSKEGEPFLFLKNTDEISINVSSPWKWSSIDAHLATFEKHFEHGWPTNWEISTKDIQNSYFIGIMLHKENSNKIGWIELEINNQSGEVNILEFIIL